MKAECALLAGSPSIWHLPPTPALSSCAGRRLAPQRRPQARNIGPSSRAQDFVRGLLVVNPAERLSIDDALHHAWLTLEEPR